MLLSNSNAPRFRYTLRSDLLGTRVLRTDPLGWDAVGISLHRDTIRHGLTTEYSVELGFVKDGRSYLQRVYEAAGIEADVRLTIEQYDPNAFEWLPYYQGRVNLTTRELTDLEFRANVENENFTQRFLNRATVAVDLLGNLSVGGSAGPAAAATTVSLHSRTLVKHFAGQVPGPQPFPTIAGNVSDDASRSQTFYFGYAQGEDSGYRNELRMQQIAGGFVSGDASSAVPIFRVPDTGQYVIEVAAEVDVEVARAGGTLKFGKVDTKFHYRINGDPSTAVELVADHFSNSFVGVYRHRFSIAPRTFSENLVPGDKIYLYAEVYVHEFDSGFDPISVAVRATEQPGTYLRIRAQTRTEPTPCTGLLAYEAFERLCQALTDEPDAFRSTYFGRPDTRRPQPMDGPGALTMVTGGFQLRGFPLPTAPAPVAPEKDTRKSLYATWQELFGSLSAAHWLGYGLETNERGNPVVRVEPAPYFYPNRVVLDLTAGPADRPSPTFRVTSKELTGRYYQSLEFGYEAWQAEQVNGLDEANTKRKWTTPLTQVDSTYSQVGKYATSAQLLELTRRQRYVSSDSTDTRGDNNNFLVCLLRRPAGGFETERNQQFSKLDGVLDPASIYNARLTPARNLRRHGAAIRAGLDANPAGHVRFTFGEGNNELVSRLVTETTDVAEKADIQVSQLATPLWRNYSDSFTAPLTRQQLQTLLADPLGRVRYYNTRRKLCEGWILDFKHEGKEQKGSFTLLPCATLP